MQRRHPAHRVQRQHDERLEVLLFMVFLVAGGGAQGRSLNRWLRKPPAQKTWVCAPTRTCCARQEAGSADCGAQVAVVDTVETTMWQELPHPRCCARCSLPANAGVPLLGAAMPGAKTKEEPGFAPAATLQPSQTDRAELHGAAQRFTSCPRWGAAGELKWLPEAKKRCFGAV